MIVKVVLLFLVFMAVLAMFGRLRLPGLPPKLGGKCPDCGRPRLGKGPCPCKAGR
ncbi:hypothetical protein [Wenxinia marina]|uniref:Uncharacterized protein n=1 Tax=Wenxinia marina DSM 24838 TaxID=1123501 RepID=A0A0D0Q7B1_9RHOB|nr:hypothetical protein [Wenxinia marina]KIQ70319.1 hypothetical protein Wenmar_00694 [Wenxinia marina DSM 24838]GGL54049.1 hypothetical protein GCM10011392_05570 [Wenxinia marina]